MSDREHWEAVYARKRPDELSWYQSEPRVSLELIEATGVSRDARILDVGGGASVLVDRLLQLGFHRLGVLDLASAALRNARSRLGEAQAPVEWIEEDVRCYRPAHPWDVWHDRAAYHFLVDPGDRELYRGTLHASVVEGGHVIIATFGPDGPTRCSGLDAARWSALEMARELGDGVRLVEDRTEAHTTPTGATQQFVYARFVRTEAST